MFDRVIYMRIVQVWNKGKAIVVMGPRQVGKTTLLKSICEEKGPYLYLNADDFLLKERLELEGVDVLRRIIGTHKTVFIDEAQRIEKAGITLKLIIDHFPEVQLVVSGSSALDISSQVNEPLTGRKFEFKLFPIAWAELEKDIEYLGIPTVIDRKLVYGMYPDVLNNDEDALTILQELGSSYLYKDIISLSGIRKPEIISKLVRALANQIGSEVNYTELGKTLRIDKNTVESYIDVLEKAYILFRLPPLSNNPRKEISSSRKIYFYDNGIRNMVIGDFRPIDQRNDKGALWENFLISERIKKQSYRGRIGFKYFWRSYQQQEIDYIEESNGVFSVYEFKYKVGKKFRFSKTFLKHYETVTQEVIDRDNFGAWLAMS